MLTFYESDEATILTDGKVVTKTYHHRPSILNKSLSEDIDNLNDMYNTLRDVVKSHAPELLI